MDWLTTSPLVVGAISTISASVLEVLLERLLTILLAALMIGGVGVFAVTAFTWLWMKRLLGQERGPASPTGAPPVSTAS